MLKALAEAGVSSSAATMQSGRDEEELRKRTEKPRG
jgi:hypothetical protein